MDGVLKDSCTANIDIWKDCKMKKTALLTALLLSVCMLFCSCGQKEEQTEVTDISRKEVVSQENTNDTNAVDKEDTSKDDLVENEEENITDESKKTLEDIRDEIILSLGASDAAPLDADSASSIYGVDPEDMVQSAGFVVMAGTFPHEIIMIEASSSDAADRISDLFKVKLDSFTEQSKGYDAKNYALAQKCKVERNGNFVSLFLSPDCDQIKGIYSKYIK